LPAVVAERDVADGAQHLALLVDLDLSVTLRGEIEPADRRPLERTDPVSEAADSFSSLANLVSAANVAF